MWLTENREKEFSMQMSFNYTFNDPQCPPCGLLLNECNGLIAVTDINLGSCSAGLSWPCAKEANEVIVIYMLADDINCTACFTRWTFIY